MRSRVLKGVVRPGERGKSETRRFGDILVREDAG